MLRLVHKSILICRCFHEEVSITNFFHDSKFFQLLFQMQPTNFHRNFRFIPKFSYLRWSPRGHILKFLALASKPQVLENCPVLGQHYLESLKVCWKTRQTSRKTCKDFCFRGCLNNFLKTFFFWRALALCVLGLEIVCSREVGHWPWIFCVFGLGLEPYCILNSTSVGYCFNRSLYSIICCAFWFLKM